MIRAKRQIGKRILSIVCAATMLLGSNTAYAGELEMSEMAVVEDTVYTETVLADEEIEVSSVEETADEAASDGVRTWTFADIAKTQKQTIQKATKFVDDIYVDASEGKLDIKDGQWTQFNNNTIVYVPVKGACKVKVKAYAASFEIDNVASDAKEFELYCHDGRDLDVEGASGKYIAIKATSNNYLEYITVTGVEPEAGATIRPLATPTPTPTPPVKSDVINEIGECTVSFAGDIYTAAKFAALDTVGFEGIGVATPENNHGLITTEGGNGTIILKLKKKANIIVTTCGYLAATNARLASSSGTVSYMASKDFNETVEGNTFTVTGAEAGECRLTVSSENGSNVYIHKLTVEYPAVAEKRNIDVWDFGGAAIADTETYTSIITDKTKSELTAAGTIKSDGIINTSGAEVELGDIFIKPNATNDYLFYSANFVSGVKYEDGYVPTGCFYTNGTGGATRRYLTIKNVQAGDKIVAYLGTANNPTSFYFEGQGTAAGQKDEFTVAAGKTYYKAEFVAEKTGSYKLWEGGAGKPVIHRVMRIPYVTLKGKVNKNGCSVSEYGIKLTNQTTGQVYDAKINADDTFEAVVAPGYKYTASMTKATGFAFTKNSKEVAVAETDGINGKEKTGVAFDVMPQTTYEYTGAIKGIAEGYDVSGLKVVLAPQDEENEKVELEILKDLSFKANLIPEVSYELQLIGVNDYEIDGETVINKTEKYTADINLKLKDTFNVTGGFLNVAPEKVTKLTFTNDEDKYVYSTDAADGKYSIKLRNGVYTVASEVADYKVVTHVVVDGKDVNKDVYFSYTGAESKLDLVKDLYVGYADKANNYETINEALKASQRMAPASEEDRITIHIAPGTYREQLMVRTPYVSFVNDSTQQVLITWYYGIGYKYYSANDKGYYDPAYVYDRHDKHSVATWGTAVYVDEKAVAFRADGITFENSFNRYVTDEELEDGVELLTVEEGRTCAVVRNAGTDVATKAATERAAALCLYADKAEFNNCEFYSSQDTLFTGNKAYRSYFKNCIIEGQTDYIFGDGNAVFDSCELSFKGYTEGSLGGYITAAKPSDSAKGYLFRSCSVTANDDKKVEVKPGYFGRPWGANAKVYFMNTMLEYSDILTPAAWYEMSGAKPEDANFREYATTDFAGAAVDTSKRVTGTVMTKAQAEAVKVTDFFGSDWTPVYYSAKTEGTLAFSGSISVVDNGDLNTPYPGHTLTVVYSLGNFDDEDVSAIKWYRVNGETKTLVKASTATASKTYKISKEDIGSYLVVEITPKTINGLTAETGTVQIEKPVLNGYEDPDDVGSDPSLGEGVNVFLAGDSTVRDYSSKCVFSSSPRDEGSWGEFLQNFFNDKVTIVNYANGGRSTRNYINEGNLDKVTSMMKEGDYLFIQFGHNDCAYQDTYKADRYVPIGTPDANGVYPVTAGTKTSSSVVAPPSAGYGDAWYTWDCGGTYKWFLKQYIDAARSKGAIPVLVTPVARMYYTAEGTIKPHHDDNTTTNNAYCEAVKQLAEEEKVLFIDGFNITKDIYEAAYKACGSKDNGSQIMANSGDTTHNNKLGGVIEAAAMAKAIKELNINISSAIKAPASVAAETTQKQTVFTVDKSGKLTAYNMLKDYAERTEYWETTGQKMFDALKSEPTATATATQGAQATATATATQGAQATATATATQGAEATATATATQGAEATATATATQGAEPTATATATQAPTPTSAPAEMNPFVAATEMGLASVKDTTYAVSVGKTAYINPSSVSGNITVAKGAKLVLTAASSGVSSDPKTVAINKTGAMKAKKAGVATITYSYAGSSRTLTVTVIDPVIADVTVSGNSIGGFKKLNAAAAVGQTYTVKVKAPLTTACTIIDKKGSTAEPQLEISTDNAEDGYIFLTGKAIAKGKTTFVLTIDGKAFKVNVKIK